VIAGLPIVDCRFSLADWPIGDWGSVLGSEGQSQPARGSTNHQSAIHNPAIINPQSINPQSAISNQPSSIFNAHGA
jgi:hypothetical protein